MTRYIPHAEFYFRQTLPCLEDCLRKAVLKGGLPEMVYVDNGPCYQARQFKLLTGRLGIHLVYATEFCPEGKGKIERWIQTVQQDFLQEAELSGATTLAELNVFFWAWLDKIYHARKHTSTGHSPKELWEGSSQKIGYVPPEKLVDIFLWEEERTVAKSGIFQLDGNRYPVAEHLVREKIQVRFDPFDLEKVRVYHNGVIVLAYAQAQEVAGELSSLVEDGGIGLLIGEVGIGKTTALRSFIGGLEERACKVCYQGANKHSLAVLQELVTQMGYQAAHLRATCLRQLSGAISRLWTEQRKKTLIVLDDAQTVEESLLEDLRLLTNFEFDSCEPLALVLIGHPSLQNRLRKPIHLALWDRLRMLYRLEGLSLDETRQYVDRHLEAAGGTGDLFTDDAKVALFDHSQGIPRRINRLALQAVKLSARNKVTVIDDKLISLAGKVFDGV